MQVYVPQLMIEPTQVVDFMDGLVFGLLQKEDLPEIQACIQHAPDIAKQISTAVEDFEKADFADIIKGISAIGAIVQNLPEDFKDCEGMDGDLKRIEAWGKIFENPSQLIMTLTTNVVAHFNQISGDVTKISTDFSSSQYKSAGEDIADIMVLSVGPVPAAQWWSTPAHKEW